MTKHSIAQLTQLYSGHLMQRANSLEMTLILGKTDAEAPILWPLDSKSQLIWKRCWERLKAGGEGGNRDEMVGWHHRLNGHEFEQAPGNSEG